MNGTVDDDGSTNIIFTTGVPEDKIKVVWYFINDYNKLFTEYIDKSVLLNGINGSGVEKIIALRHGPNAKVWEFWGTTWFIRMTCCDFTPTLEELYYGGA